MVKTAHPEHLCGVRKVRTDISLCLFRHISQEGAKWTRTGDPRDAQSVISASFGGAAGQIHDVQPLRQKGRRGLFLGMIPYSRTTDSDNLHTPNACTGYERCRRIFRSVNVVTLRSRGVAEVPPCPTLPEVPFASPRDPFYSKPCRAHYGHPYAVFHAPPSQLALLPQGQAAFTGPLHSGPIIPYIQRDREVSSTARSTHIRNDALGDDQGARLTQAAGIRTRNCQPHESRQKA